MIDIECIVCGTVRRQFPYTIRNGHGKFCGMACAGSYRRGKPNGRKGISMPSTRGANNVMAREDVRKKHLANVQRGENHPHWKGGVTPLYKQIRKSPAYIDWRTAVFARDDYTCQICGLAPGQGKRVDLQADHIKPFALYPELRFDIDNGRTLCIPCHRQTPTWGGKILTLKKES
jgi:hypothetical protein